MFCFELPEKEAPAMINLLSDKFLGVGLDFVALLSDSDVAGGADG